ncbi:MAG: fluoride efflux transporter CrcB [Clostridiales bacterium]|nr:fluoride efflux transporter CrcB [Clostridiales bacterium]
MINVLIVGAGGFLGTVFRYLLGLIPLPVDFPFITLGMNFLGSFIIGLVYGFSIDGVLSSKKTLFFKTGFCGGFTTFSSFSLEAFNLIDEKKYLLSGIYILLSIVLCIFGTFLGVLLSRKIKTF